MDGRIGWSPAVGCQRALVGGSLAVGSASRDRIAIELGGIGDAVRSSAAGRGLTVAAFARQALVGALSDAPTLVESLDAPSPRVHGTVKLTWRMDAVAAEALVASARSV